jgi:uncharacterized integral membrane protein
MTDDGGRGRPDRPVHGSVGPVDPTADPLTDPGMRAVAVPADRGTDPLPLGPGTSTEPATAGDPRRSRTGGLWVGLILSALVLLLLLVFILQNSQPVQISFFALDGVLPTGVALLLAAIAGILLVAIPGSMRILQLRRAARRR